MPRKKREVINGYNGNHRKIRHSPRNVARAFAGSSIDKEGYFSDHYDDDDAQQRYNEAFKIAKDHCKLDKVKVNLKGYNKADKKYE